MNLSLTHTLLERAFRTNHMPIPRSKVVFGIRGVLPVNQDCHVSPTHEVYTTQVNYVNPRCTIGIWDTVSGSLQLFAGSTVPHQKYILEAKVKGGEGANQMFPGLYQGYTLGVHNAGQPTGHPALRQTQPAAVRRTADDMDYDGLDRVEVKLTNNNIHASWAMSVDAVFFGSAGCQTLVGYPKGANRDKATGPYAAFIQAIKESGDTIFPYFLATANELIRLTQGVGQFTTRLKYGSNGDQVKKVQKALGLTEDGDFGGKTFLAVCKFQEKTFGFAADDGIVGPQTAQALGITLPNIYYHGFREWEWV